jgi:hypothetical protein
LRSKKDARDQKGSKVAKYQLLKDGYMEVKSSGSLGNVAEMKNTKCNRCKYETILHHLVYLLFTPLKAQAFMLGMVEIESISSLLRAGSKPCLF